MGIPSTVCMEKPQSKSVQKSCCKIMDNQSCCCFDKEKACYCMQPSEEVPVLDEPIYYVQLKKTTQTIFHVFYLNQKYFVNSFVDSFQHHPFQRLSIEIQKILPLLN